MTPDPWFNLRSRSTARIALGRAGGSLPTQQCLQFAADHAEARDAVYAELDLAAFQQSVGQPVISLHSRATDRATYLQRPDLGRRLDSASADLLRSRAGEPVDVVLIVADGLSATAAQKHAATLLHPLIELLTTRRFNIGPLCAVRQARVAIEDEIGWLLRAKLAVILIGERPGLRSADSLGAYLVYDPIVGRHDAQRNCVSNIHPDQLSPTSAANALLWLIKQSLGKRLSGVGLKDERSRLNGSAPAPLL